MVNRTEYWLCMAKWLIGIYGVLSILPVWRHEHYKSIHEVVSVSDDPAESFTGGRSYIVKEIGTKTLQGCVDAEIKYKNLRVGDRFELERSLYNNFWNLDFRTGINSIDKILQPKESTRLRRI